MRSITALSSIRETISCGTCSGHPALARAIATLLLRCQRAQLTQRAASTVAAAKAGGVVGALVIGGIEAAKHLFGK